PLGEVQDGDAGHDRRRARGHLPRERRRGGAGERPRRARRRQPRAPQRPRRQAPGGRRHPHRALAPPQHSRRRIRRPGAHMKTLYANIEDVMREAAARWTLLTYFFLSTIFILIFASAINLDIVDGALAGAKLFGHSVRDTGNYSIEKLVLGF